MHHSRRKAAPTAAAAPRPASTSTSPPPRSVLLVKTSSLGDVIHNLPVVSDLQRCFPDCRIDWLVEESFQDIPRLHPAIHRVIPVALRQWRKALTQAATWQEIRAFRENLQSQDYDLVIDTQGLIKSALLARFARLSPLGKRSGYAHEAAREPLAARFYDQTYAIPKNVHAVERNRWLAAAACDMTPGLPLDYGLSHLPPRRAAGPASWQGEEPFAVLLTATSRDDKLWPEDHWLHLMQHLAGEGLRCLLPAGSVQERERAGRIAASLKAPLDARVAPPLPITGIADLCRDAKIVIGVDTGLTHLAAALGKPALALFCASHPDLTGVYTGDPPASPVINLGSHGHPPSADEAMAAVRRLLG